VNTVLMQVFNWLPLAAHVENKILCMHGGIGRSINRIKQIEVLYRPLTMEQGGVVLMDLLWSDPTTNDGVQARATLVLLLYLSVSVVTARRRREPELAVVHNQCTILLASSLVCAACAF
jgi:diadenosine tetraphosphatase ApaH/serine/threonine PP2A family protein phosphatase